jgi:GDP-L-fucose synthase
MDTNSKIFVAGHRGLVGTAILKRLHASGYTRLLTKTHKELDLTRQSDVEAFFKAERPEYVFLAAAKVGGIGANSQYPGEFIYQNLAIATNIVHASYCFGVKKLLNLGSSCIFPKLAPQPIKEEYLLTGALEPTNEAYAVAKIAAIRLCKHYNEQYGTNYFSAMPTNLYGLKDNYDPDNSHVLPGMIRKIHNAKESGTTVTLWGDGSPLREFLHADDLAAALVFLMEKYDYRDIGEFINIGSGQEISIRELAALVSNVVGYKGEILWDSTKPNGTPRKLLDSSRLRALGWKPSIQLADGIQQAYQDFLIMEKENAQ